MSSKQNKVLVIGMTNCVHVARWTQWFEASCGSDIELHAFPSTGLDVHPGMRNVTIHGAPLYLGRRVHPTVRLRRQWWWPFPRGLFSEWMVRQQWLRQWEALRLARLIDRLQPQVIHLIETQNAGYLFLDAQKLCRRPMTAKLVLSVMGSDVFHFHEVPYHRQRIKGLLSTIDVLHIDCERDRAMVQKLGYTGEVIVQAWFLLPERRRQQAAWVSDPRERQLVLVRGSDYWAVDGLTAIAAVQLASQALSGFEIVVYSAGRKVCHRIRQLQRAGMNIRALKRQTNDEMWDLFAQARVLLSVSRSDGTLVAMLEAMAMGCFPIVSRNTYWNGWLEPGKTGLVLQNQDPSEIRAALEAALKRDDLVSHAARVNQQKVLEQFPALNQAKFISRLYDLSQRKADRGDRPSTAVPLSSLDGIPLS